MLTESAALGTSNPLTGAINAVTITNALTHTYDAKNRLNKTQVGAAATDTVTYKINAMGQRVQKVGAGLYAPSTVATIDAATGNSPLSRSIAFNARFTYDEQGRLIGEYAPDGKLIAETIWFNDLPIATLRPKGSNNQIPLGTPGTTATQANNVGNNTTANKVNVDIYYVHADHLGTPRVVTRSAAVGAATTGPNAINKQVWSANTDPFGTALGNSAPNENPQLVAGTATVVQAATFRLNHRFDGQLYDADTGKHYNNKRIFGPSEGRYVESDPLGLNGGLSTYGYVGQNPLIRTDPTGEIWQLPILYCLRFPKICAGVALCFKNPVACKNSFCKAGNWLYHPLCDAKGCRAGESCAQTVLKSSLFEGCYALRLADTWFCNKKTNPEHERERATAWQKGQECLRLIPVNCKDDCKKDCKDEFIPRGPDDL
jgi:RHS repeat-associated protein